MVISWVSLGIDGGLSSSKCLQQLWKITMFKWVNSIANCKRLPEGTGEFFYACVNLVEAWFLYWYQLYSLWYIILLMASMIFYDVLYLLNCYNKWCVIQLPSCWKNNWIIQTMRGAPEFRFKVLAVPKGRNCPKSSDEMVIEIGNVGNKRRSALFCFHVGELLIFSQKLKNLADFISSYTVLIHEYNVGPPR